MAPAFDQHVGDAELTERAAVPVTLGIGSATAVSGFESFCVSYFASTFFRSSQGPTARPISGPCPRMIGSINPCQVCSAQLCHRGLGVSMGPRGRSEHEGLVGLFVLLGPFGTIGAVHVEALGYWCDTSRVTPSRDSSSA